MGKKLGNYLLSDRHATQEMAGIKVTTGRDLSTNQSITVKIFDMNMFEASQPGGRELLEFEARTMSKTNAHPNVLQLVDVLASSSKVFVVLEGVGGRDLFDVIDAEGRLQEELARNYFGQILDAIEHCHSRGVVHRDVKPENIIVTAQGVLKLTGFALAGFFDPCKGADDVTNLFHVTCGTLDYIAPEVLQGIGYEGRLADIWSLGVTLYCMLAGFLPFEADNNTEKVEKIQARYFKIAPGMSLTTCSLLDGMLEPDPKKRFTIERVRSHPWLAQRPSIGSSSLPIAAVTVTAAAKSATTDGRPPIRSRSGGRGGGGGCRSGRQEALPERAPANFAPFSNEWGGRHAPRGKSFSSGEEADQSSSASDVPDKPTGTTGAHHGGGNNEYSGDMKPASSGEPMRGEMQTTVMTVTMRNCVPDSVGQGTGNGRGADSAGIGDADPGGGEGARNYSGPRVRYGADDGHESSSSCSCNNDSNSSYPDSSNSEDRIGNASSSSERSPNENNRPISISPPCCVSPLASLPAQVTEVRGSCPIATRTSQARKRTLPGTMCREELEEENDLEQQRQRDGYTGVSLQLEDLRVEKTRERTISELRIFRQKSAVSSEGFRTPKTANTSGSERSSASDGSPRLHRSFFADSLLPQRQEAETLLLPGQSIKRGDEAIFRAGREAALVRLATLQAAAAASAATVLTTPCPDGSETSIPGSSTISRPVATAAAWKLGETKVAMRRLDQKRVLLSFPKSEPLSLAKSLLRALKDMSCVCRLLPNAKHAARVRVKACRCATAGTSHNRGEGTIVGAVFSVLYPGASATLHSAGEGLGGGGRGGSVALSPADTRNTDVLVVLGAGNIEAFNHLIEDLLKMKSRRWRTAASMLL